MRFLLIGFFAILIFVAIALPIYYFIYRRRINRALEDENAVVGATPEPRSGGKLLLWLFVIFLAFSLLNQLGQLSDSVRNLQNYDLDSFWAPVLSQMQDAQQKANSLLLSFEAKLTNLDLSSKTVEAVFRVVPKQFRADTRLSLQLDDRSIELQRDAQNAFSATVPLDPFRQPENNRVTLYKIEDGQTTTESVELDLILADLMPIPKAWMDSFDLQVAGAGYKLQNAVAQLSTNGQLSDLTVAVRVGDKTLRKFPVSVPEGGFALCDLSGEYQTSSELQFWISWKNADGFSFEYQFCSAFADEESISSSTGMSGINVYGPDGSQLGVLPCN